MKYFLSKKQISSSYLDWWFHFPFQILEPKTQSNMWNYFFSLLINRSLPRVCYVSVPVSLIFFHIVREDHTLHDLGLAARIICCILWLLQACVTTWLVIALKSVTSFSLFRPSFDMCQLTLPSIAPCLSVLWLLYTLSSTLLLTLLRQELFSLLSSRKLSSTVRWILIM